MSERSAVVGVGRRGEHLLGAVEERSARALQDGREHGRLAREVPVDGGAAHADRRTRGLRS